MDERRVVLFLSALVVLTVLAVSPVLGETPAVESAEPDRGFVDEPTDVALSGERFDTGSGVLFTHGGPFVTRSYETPDLAWKVRVAGDLAYVIGGTSLTILDISGSAGSALVGTHPLPESPADLAFADGYVYVANGTNGLQVIDVRDPRAPALAGSYDTPDFAGRIAVAGGHAYVADDDGGLLIFDVSDPTAPALVASYPTPSSASAVAVAGSHAYVTDNDQGLLILDIGNPQTPTIVGNFVTPGRAFHVAVAGDYAYVPVERILQVIDVSDPVSPVLAGEVGKPGSVRDIAVAGDHVFVSTVFPGLQVIDVSDPEEPFVAGALYVPGLSGVAAAGDYVYATERSFSPPNYLQVIDVSDPVSPEIGKVIDGRFSVSVALAGDYAYVADRPEGLLVVDVRDPRAPTLAGSYGDLTTAWDVAVAGQYAYVADDSSGMRVIDVSDPRAPDLVATWDTSGSSRGVTTSGNYAYLTNVFRGIYILNVSDPLAPVFVGRHVGQVNDVAVAGNYAYVAGDAAIGRFGLRVLDISNPQNPQRLSALVTPGDAERIAVAGNHVYMADGRAGLTIVDVGDPRAPVLAGSYEITSGSATDVVLRGDLAYLTVFGGEGLEILDISDPSDPALVGRLGKVTWGGSVALTESHAYVANGYDGLWVVPLNPMLRDIAAVSDTRIELTVPAGFSPGPYDVVVANPGPETGKLHNGFRVCERRTLDADLEPVLDFTLPAVRRRGVSWTLELDGDETFFDPRVRHRGMLLLPELPADLVTRVEPGDGSERIVVELNLAPRLDSGEVVLTGDDPAALTAMWESLQQAGGLSMPRLDDYTYGEVMLRLNRGPGSGNPMWRQFGTAHGDRIGRAQAPVRYRYVLSADGLLSRARAQGPGVDLVFKATGEDRYRCETADTVSFVETLREICDEAGAANPDLLLRCPR